MVFLHDLHDVGDHLGQIHGAQVDGTVAIQHGFTILIKLPAVHVARDDAQLQYRFQAGFRIVSRHALHGLADGSSVPLGQCAHHAHI